MLTDKHSMQIEARAAELAESESDTSFFARALQDYEREELATKKFCFSE